MNIVCGYTRLVLLCDSERRRASVETVWKATYVGFFCKQLHGGSWLEIICPSKHIRAADCVQPLLAFGCFELAGKTSLLVRMQASVSTPCVISIAYCLPVCRRFKSCMHYRHFLACPRLYDIYISSAPILVLPFSAFILSFRLGNRRCLPPLKIMEVLGVSRHYVSTL